MSTSPTTTRRVDSLLLLAVHQRRLTAAAMHIFTTLCLLLTTLLMNALALPNTSGSQKSRFVAPLNRLENKALDRRYMGKGDVSKAPNGGTIIGLPT